ncbi:class I SAM-dependent methyltransferase [Natronobeatus ordinarius]|uniref:class I SAM-dependent methyltransferase n=1 Tax=Natronobeatus ordinarius TaxID=2963433 RepID=UPI0020CD7BFC|nr:class I SAM-dependent methyltransferase [Natronobeatus ordinarius]
MTDDDIDRKRAAAASFDDHASAYVHSPVHREGADLEQLASWCADADCALDVATGAGHAAGALLEAGVDAVVAADASPTMVATALEEYPGLRGTVVDAERLPFADDAFDAVTCRIAAHHFPNPDRFVREVARVLAPGGTVALEDNVAPPEASLEDFLNEVERLRDPTHVRSYTEREWRSWFADAGLAVEETQLLKKTLEYERWVATLEVPPERRERLERRFANPPPGACEAFDLAYDNEGIVQSFSSVKLLLRATPSAVGTPDPA